MKTAELFDVRGLATIVTGAASGIGLAYAEVMADNGARVTLMDKDAAAPITKTSLRYIRCFLSSKIFLNRTPYCPTLRTLRMGSATPAESWKPLHET